MKTATCRELGFTLVEIMIVMAIITLLAVIAIPNYVRARGHAQTNVCINNLRQIDDASQQWALDYRKAPDATVSFTDIQPYMKGEFVCPSGGTAATFADSYTITTVSNKPLCKIVPDVHVLPADSSQPSAPKVTPL